MSVFDFVDGFEEVPIEVMRTADPLDVVAFYTNDLKSETDPNFKIDDNLEFIGDITKYPNLQLYCITYLKDCLPVAKCTYNGGMDIFGYVCPEVYEVWQIIKTEGLYNIEICGILNMLGIIDEELEANVAIFNAKFTNHVKSARTG